MIFETLKQDRHYFLTPLIAFCHLSSFFTFTHSNLLDRSHDRNESLWDDGSYRPGRKSSKRKGEGKCVVITRAKR